MKSRRTRTIAFIMGSICVLFLVIGIVFSQFIPLTTKYGYIRNGNVKCTVDPTDIGIYPQDLGLHILSGDLDTYNSLMTQLPPDANELHCGYDSVRAKLYL